MAAFCGAWRNLTLQARTQHHLHISASCGWHALTRPHSVACPCSEAENIEEEAEIEQDQAAFNAGEGEEGDNPLGQIDEKSRAIILINATGIIQMANKV